MSQFSFNRDFGRIQLGPTLGLNLVRMIASAAFWGVILFLLQQPVPFWGVLIGYPFIFCCALLPLWGMFLAMAKLLPAAGLLTIAISMLTSVGDPLVFVLHKMAPSMVPVRQPPLLFWSPIVVVYAE